MSQDDPHLLCWNGAKIQLFAARSAERFRGPEADGGWGDEIDSWKPDKMTQLDAWALFDMGIRTGPDPRLLGSTTPRRGRLVSRLKDRKNVCITRASMEDNRANLAEEFIEAIEESYGNTRMWRQEAMGELLPDVEGAIVSMEMIDDARVAADDCPELVRVVVGVDPYGGGGDACGIGAAGKGVDGNAYVLSDRTCRLGPEGWGRRVMELYVEREADAIAIERNFGGDMVLSVVKSAAKDMGLAAPRFTKMRGKAGVWSSKAKHVRFERRTGLMYEQGIIHHVGDLPELEDEVTQFTPQGWDGEGSPNRADQLVFAIEELFPLTAGLSPSDLFSNRALGIEDKDEEEEQEGAPA